MIFMGFVISCLFFHKLNLFIYLHKLKGENDWKKLLLLELPEWLDLTLLTIYLRIQIGTFLACADGVVL